MADSQIILENHIEWEKNAQTKAKGLIENLSKANVDLRQALREAFSSAVYCLCRTYKPYPLEIKNDSWACRMSKEMAKAAILVNYFGYRLQQEGINFENYALGKSNNKPSNFSGFEDKYWPTLRRQKFFLSSVQNGNFSRHFSPVFRAKFGMANPEITVEERDKLQASLNEIICVRPLKDNWLQSNPALAS